MKHKTSELTGARLDQAVAKACGYMYDNAIDRTVVSSLDGSKTTLFFSFCAAVIDGKIREFSPSSVWADGGPIIERKKIGCYWIEEESLWRAGLDMHGYTPEFNLAQSHGPTLLISAMRSFVTTNLGDEVEL